MNLIELTKTYLKSELKTAESGHDFQHACRVWKVAKHLADFYPEADRLCIELAALLHDVADSKFHDGDEELGPKKAKSFLEKHKVEASKIVHIQKIIRYLSFKGGHNKGKFESLELTIVQDADRLDAIGAIGVARTFNYGGFKNHELYNPDRPPNLNKTAAEYKAGGDTTINHFYEKLLLLKGLLNTKEAKRIAEKRHQFMEQFLDQFYEEWYSKDL
ncbi:MAG: HD domain-containing protein [Flavobacteriales bacterium]